MRVVVALGIVHALLMACATATPSSGVLGSKRSVAVPPGVASGVAWLDEDTLWVGLDHDPSAQRPESVPWLINILSGEATLVPLGKEDGCFLGDYLSAGRVDDTRASFLRSCSRQENVDAGDFSSVEKSLVIIGVDGSFTEGASLPDAATAVTWTTHRRAGS